MKQETEKKYKLKEIDSKKRNCKRRHNMEKN